MLIPRSLGNQRLSITDALKGGWWRPLAARVLYARVETDRAAEQKQRIGTAG